MALPPPAPTSSCLVTGASSGIGAEIARDLARRGYGVTLVARRAEQLKELAAELTDSCDVRTEYMATDLTDAEQRAALVRGMAERELDVEVLVNNAGFSTMGPVATSDPGKELALVRTNVEAVVDLCSRFIPPMTERRRGAVLNTASTAAFQPLAGQAGYAASKAFVLSYSHALRAEVKARGVTVSALCPGPVDTGFAEAAGMSHEEAMSSLPGFMWVPAVEVARAAVEGLNQGRAVIIPGVANKVVAAAGYMAPRGVIGEIMVRSHPALKGT
jgi:uncharacterized protein